MKLRAAYFAATREVERTIGRKLKGTELVHHVDENPWNNEHTNLVVCPNQAYHMLIHLRQRAYDYSGDPDKRACDICHTYDFVSNLSVRERKNRVNGFHYRHVQCGRDAAKAWYARKKEAKQNGAD